MQEGEDVCEEVGSLLGDAVFYLPWVTVVWEVGMQGELCSQTFSFIIQTQTSSYSVAWLKPCLCEPLMPTVGEHDYPVAVLQSEPVIHYK